MFVGDPEVDRPSMSAGITTNKRHIRSYSQEVTIKQSKRGYFFGFYLTSFFSKRFREQ